MKKYPSYRDSGLAWSGEIPAHWDTKRLKLLAALNPSKDLTKVDKDSVVVFLPMENVSSEGMIDNSLKRRAGEVWEGFTYFERNDILIAKITPCFENGKGALLDRLATEVGFGSTEFTVLRAGKDVLPPFLYYVTKSYPFRRQGEDFMTGSAGQQRVPTSFVRNYPVCVPPLNEQLQIVNYLNSKLEQIDQFINNKLQMIALLEEQRAALINRSITQGLNAAAEFKRSDVEWLGNVPNHWESKRAKFFFREVDERSESGEEELLSVSHITGVTPRSEKNITMFMAESYEGYKTCQRGDLVINIMWAWMGALGVSEYNGIVSSAYGVYRQRDNNNFYAPYLDYLLRTKGYVAEFTCRSKGVTSSRARMYTDDFFDVHIVRPPYEEQVEIVRHVKRESQTVDKAIAKANQEIELIQEFRTTLISDAVTGKIDVRLAEAAATVSLPAEVVPFSSPQAEPKHRRKASPAFKRTVLGAEIVHQLHGEMTFGKWKLQKLLYLCEHHVGLHDIESNYIRDAAGPHDNNMMRSVLSQMESIGWYKFDDTAKYGEKFIPLSKAGRHREYFQRYWGERRESIQYVIDLFRKEKTDWCQMVATLYAAWNDFLLAGQPVNDNAIVKEVLSDWHPSKREIPEQVWRKALAWMRELNFAPSGFGRPTHFKKRSKPRKK